jgi:hypothetical protein
LSDFPEEIRPELVAVLTGVDEALQVIESTDASNDPMVLLSAAIEQVRGIEGRLISPSNPKSGGNRSVDPVNPAALDSPSVQRLRRWAEDWVAVRTTLGAGDLLRARQLLKPYEL